MKSFAPRAAWPASLLAGLVVVSAASLCGVAWAADASAPQAQARSRLFGAIDDNDRVTLSGNRHPRLNRAEDRGRADDAMVVRRMILTLSPDAEQQRALEAFMASRRDPTSPFYGQWLTPAEYERQFGVSDADLAKVTQWLQSQGFTVDEVPQGRRSIVFSGAVRHIRKAFRTDMRQFRVDGRDHIANAADPSIPDALSAVVSGVVSLHDFRSRPMHANVRPAPNFTDSGGGHAMAAADFATIYNTKSPVAQGIDGTGVSIAVLGRTNVVMGDMTTFRSAMGLPANPPQIILNGADPGRQTGDEGESDLDLQWAGAVAPGATIKFVTSASTASTDGIDLSAQYAVSNNVADIVTLSYGLCEADLGTSATNFYNGLWQQAAAQGMSVFVSSGDSGAADCDASDATTATRGRGVNGLCTSPFSTCVGGTQFDDTANPSQYWTATNATNLGSALSYIPEKVWNESGNVSGGSGLWSSGGGASTVFTQPSWQTGVGVPNNGRRNVPDVSLAAASHDGYLVYSSDNTTSTRTRYVFGGTSAAAPSFAGLMALVNQKAGARQGNANPRFYQLAALQANGGPGYFHAVQGGNNSVPGVTGFTATTGTVTPIYNQATGLGSVDGSVLVNQWAATLAASTTSLAANPATGGYNQSVTFTATVAGGGTATPTGTVQFKDGSANLGSAVAVSNGVASLTTAALAPGNHSISAVYSGDGANAASASTSLSYTVAQVVSTVSVRSSVSSTLQGQGVTFTASLTGKSVSGSLQFMDGNTVLATVPLVACPTAFSTSALGVGVHQITVVYSGDANNAPSTSAALTHTVTAPLATTSSALSASASSVVVGQALNLSVTVSATSGDGSNLPTGTVQFMDGSVALGAPVALSSGVAAFSTNALSVGNHSLTAVYSGDAANAASTSAQVNVSVAQATSTVALAGPGAATQGQGVSFTATLDGASPTGVVTFMDGTATLGVVNVSAGKAIFTTSALSVGTHSITAVYSGDANNRSSVSAAFSVTVSAADSTSDGDVPTLPEWAFLLTALLLLTGLVRRGRA